MTMMRRLAMMVIGLAAFAGTVVAGQRGQAPAAATEPLMVLDTAKGSIEIQLFRSDAPKSVEHIVALVNKSFYRSQRFHRVEASLVQFGDPQSRDMTKMASWGTGSSYSPIGVAEISKRRHVRGAVGLAHAGNASLADSQIYIMKTGNPSLDNKYTIIGQVTKGMDVVDRIEKSDLIKIVTIKEAGQK